MPRYVMTRKLWSLAGAADIRDVERGGDPFRVRGKLSGLADQFSLEDPHGRQLAAIYQRLRLRPPRYEIVQDGRLTATVQAVSTWRNRLEIQIGAAGRLEATGDILGMKFQITDQGTPVASIRTSWRLGGGRYHVEIAADRDQVLMLAVVVAIEAIHRHAT